MFPAVIHLYSTSSQSLSSYTQYLFLRLDRPSRIEGMCSPHFSLWFFGDRGVHISCFLFVLCWSQTALRNHLKTQNCFFSSSKPLARTPPPRPLLGFLHLGSSFPGGILGRHGREEQGYLALCRLCVFSALTAWA